MTHKDAGQAGSGELHAALYAAGCALAEQAARTKGAASFEFGDTRDAFMARATGEAVKAMAVLEFADSHASLSAERDLYKTAADNAALDRIALLAENATLRALLVDSSRKFEVIALTLVTEDLSTHDLRELRTLADQGELAIDSALSLYRKGP